jgi:hypothetical protein
MDPYPKATGTLRFKNISKAGGYQYTELNVEAIKWLITISPKESDSACT